MNPLKRTAEFCCDRLVGLAPQSVLNSLRRNHYELVAREFNRAFKFDWSQAKIGERPQRFEDLVSLFELSPMSRGIIRQDFDEAAALFRWVRSLPDPVGVVRDPVQSPRIGPGREQTRTGPLRHF